MSTVDVSVLTPSFGYARYIQDAIDSVKGQDGVTTQHVVQDAGSTDGTVELLEDAGVDWRSEPDEGQSDALNRALERATGIWVSWLNADEFYLPGSLAYLVGVAETSGADVVYGDVVFVDAAGRIERLLAQHRYDRTTLYHYGTIIPSVAVLIRRSALGTAPWDPTLRLLMDRDLYLGLASRGAKIIHTKRPIGAFRVHDERVSAADSSTFHSDYDTIARRFERTSKAKKFIATTKHRLLKLLDGSYARQKRVASLEGTDVRWFDSPAGVEGCRALLERYGARTER